MLMQSIRFWLTDSLLKQVISVTAMYHIQIHTKKNCRNEIKPKYIFVVCQNQAKSTSQSSQGSLNVHPPHNNGQTDGIENSIRFLFPKERLILFLYHFQIQSTEFLNLYA